MCNYWINPTQTQLHLIRARCMVLIAVAFIFPCAISMTGLTTRLSAQSLSMRSSEHESSNSDTSSTFAEKANRLRMEREELESRISSLEIAINTLSVSYENEWLVKSYRFERDQLRFLDITYSQHQSLLEMIQHAGSEDAAIDTEIRQISDQQLAERKVVSFSELESLRAAIDKQSSRVDTYQSEVDSGKALAEVIEHRAESKERDARRLRENFDADDASLAMQKIERELICTELMAQVSRANLARQRLEIAYRETQLEATKKSLRSLSSLLEAVDSRVVFSQADLEHQLVLLSTREAKLRDELTSIQEQLERVSSEEFRSAADDASLTSLQRAEILETLRLVRESLQQQRTYVNSTLSELVVLQYCWTIRHAVATENATDAQLTEVRNIAETFITRYDGIRASIELQFNETRSNHETLGALLHEEQTRESLTAPWLEMRYDSNQALFESGNRRLAHIQSAEAFFQRLIQEIDAEQSDAGATANVWGLLGTARNWWSYELFAVEDNPITIGKIITAVLMLVFGLFFSRRFSRTVGNRMLPRLGMHEGASLAMQTIVFYGLTVAIVFFTLEMLNIPITVFTFLGGAAAIAVGFGSQTLLNNFISGLIILGEQPVRVGDLVEIDGVQGNISHIGARSTKIKTGSNIEIIVPNSKFMENQLTNWTLSSTEIRAQVNVGVAYGSPTDEVFRLLRQALDENEHVQDSPEPIILFADFGSDALNFELHFWIRMKTVMDGKRVESDVRRKIDQLFRTHDITIAFPQRDVHLDINRPIEVNLADKVSRQAPRRAA